MRTMHRRRGSVFDRRAHAHDPHELLGGAVMIVAAITAVTVAIVDASSISARVNGGADPDHELWFASFAVALATLVLGGLAHTGHAASRSRGAHVAYGVAAACNAAVALLVTLPSDVSFALPVQQVLAMVMLAWLATGARTT